MLLTCLLQLITGAVTALGLYATTGALTPLLAGGPTGERVRDALPALIVVTAAACARSIVAALTVAEAMLCPAPYPASDRPGHQPWLTRADRSAFRSARAVAACARAAGRAAWVGEGATTSR